MTLLEVLSKYPVQSLRYRNRSIIACNNPGYSVFRVYENKGGIDIPVLLEQTTSESLALEILVADYEVEPYKGHWV